jgi:ABC-type multidrug transport system ATPase subunit
MVLGVDLRDDRTAVRGRVGLLGHASGLYGDLSVEENVEFFAAASGVGHKTSRAAGSKTANKGAANKEAANKEARDSLARMAVPVRLHGVPVHSLSAGQKKRVSFAAMLCRRPELWLLDEPHSGLDETARNDLDDMLCSAAAAGATVLMASHELDRAGEVAGRTIEISGGMSK